MIDLKAFALLVDGTVAVVQHLPCGDKHGAINLDEALDWAGNHVCGQ